MQTTAWIGLPFVPFFPPSATARDLPCHLPAGGAIEVRASIAPQTAPRRLEVSLGRRGSALVRGGGHETLDRSAVARGAGRGDRARAGSAPLAQLELDRRRAAPLRANTAGRSALQPRLGHRAKRGRAGGN